MEVITLVLMADTNASVDSVKKPESASPAMNSTFKAPRCRAASDNRPQQDAHLCSNLTRNVAVKRELAMVLSMSARPSQAMSCWGTCTP